MTVITPELASDQLSQLPLSLSSARKSTRGGDPNHFTIGAFIGEEWIYYRHYVERMETCTSVDEACVLEFNVEAYEVFRELLHQNGLSKDVYMLESQIKRSYATKKAGFERFWKSH